MRDPPQRHNVPYARQRPQRLHVRRPVITSHRVLTPFWPAVTESGGWACQPHRCTARSSLPCEVSQDQPGGGAALTDLDARAPSAISRSASAVCWPDRRSRCRRFFSLAGLPYARTPVQARARLDHRVPRCRPRRRSRVRPASPVRPARCPPAPEARAAFSDARTRAAGFGTGPAAYAVLPQVRPLYSQPAGIGPGSRRC